MSRWEAEAKKCCCTCSGSWWGHKYHKQFTVYMFRPSTKHIPKWHPVPQAYYAGTIWGSTSDSGEPPGAKNKPGLLLILALRLEMQCFSWISPTNQKTDGDIGRLVWLMWELLEIQRWHIADTSPSIVLRPRVDWARSHVVTVSHLSMHHGLGSFRQSEVIVLRLVGFPPVCWPIFSGFHKFSLVWNTASVMQMLGHVRT